MEPITEDREDSNKGKVEFETDGPHCPKCFVAITGSYENFCDNCGIEMEWEEALK